MLFGYWQVHWLWPAFCPWLAIGIPWANRGWPCTSRLPFGTALIVTLATLLWTTGSLAARFPVFATLMNVSWRIFTIAGFALVVSATKWPQGNSLCLYLVGYYFPFVVLESCLSIFHLQAGQEV